MSPEQIASILWRRRLAFLVTFIVAMAAVVAVTLLLPKTYTATTTLYVGGKVNPEAFINTDLLEQHARTYSTLAGNPNMADLVVGNLDEPIDRGELLTRMSFAPVERTQLLQITASGATPAEAQEVANVYSETFVQRMSSLFAEGRTPAEIAISEPAALPTSPAKPNPPLYIGLGGLLSLFLALAVALLRERLDTRVRVAAEDDAVFGQPIIARIPPLEGRDRSRRGISDRFALLKTNIDFVNEGDARVLLITSPGAGEGKSTVSANLALVCAEDGERVVLVEADLRRPGLGNTVVAEGLQRSRVGLSNYLAGAAGEEEIIVPHPELRGLSLIWSGIVPPNPTALLGSHRLDTLVTMLRLEYDRVIVDTCPISVAADASVIASRVDGTIYIMDERTTKRTEAQAGLNQLRGVRTQLLGVVLNRASMVGADPYYYADEAKQEREASERVESF